MNHLLRLLVSGIIGSFGLAHADMTNVRFQPNSKLGLEAKEYMTWAFYEYCPELVGRGIDILEHRTDVQVRRVDGSVVYDYSTVFLIARAGHGAAFTTTKAREFSFVAQKAHPVEILEKPCQ